MKDFFSSLSFKIMIVVAGILVGLILFETSTNSFSTPSELLGVIVSPITKTFNSITNNTKDFFDKIIRAAHYKQETEDLKKQIDELNKKLFDYDNIKNENEQLKTMTDIKEEHIDFDMVTANISSRDSDNLYSFNVNKGSLSGIKKNDPVITGSGLVGIVTSVAPTYSQITTILSPDIQVSCYDSRTTETGALTGKSDLAIEGKCRMNYLDKNSSADVDDTIVTAGASGLFPPNILVGHVLSSGISENGMSGYLIIRPTVAIKDITEVQIVTSFTGKSE